MQDLTEKALEICNKEKASYSDIRIVTISEENMNIKNGNFEVMSLSQVKGFGIRVIANGGLGFAGSYNLDLSEIEQTAKLAVKIAKASASTRKNPINFIEEKAVKDRYFTPMKKDPFKIPIEEKLDILIEAEKRLREYNTGMIKLSQSDYRAHKEEKVFASSEGSFIEQDIIFCGGGISCVAISPTSTPQVRSYPGSFRGDFATRGYEFFEQLDLLGNAEKTAQEAIAISQAPKCPSGQTTLVLGGHQLNLQIHESIGHPTELDRVLGTEAAYAGTSFLTPDLLNKLQLGSKHVTLTADSTIPGGLGTFGYDDEGVKAKRVELVKEGLFTGYQSSRETAAILGLKESSGGMRADNPQKLPLIRMVNINLEPNGWKKAEIIEETKDGILMETNKSWSIDDKRVNFQFGTEIAWKITNGELTHILKNPTYTGITPDFWGSLDASSEDDWRTWGTPNCGKGQPSQTMYVGHGCGTARFHNIRVGVM
jgi:TldD protein